MKDRNGKEHDESNGRFTSTASTPAELKRADEITGETSVRKDEPSKKGRAKSQSELFGTEFVGYKGDKAIEKLLLERQGHIKNAFTRPETGDIDLIWGDESVGILHIIQRREKQNIDGLALVRQIPKIIEKGEFIYDENRDRFDIEYEGNRVVIKPTFDGKKVKWLMTAMEIKKPLGN